MRSIPNDIARPPGDGPPSATQPRPERRAHSFLKSSYPVRFAMGRELMALRGELLTLSADPRIPDPAGLLARTIGMVGLIAQEAYAVGDDHYPDPTFRASVDELIRQLGNASPLIAAVASPHRSRLIELREGLPTTDRRRH